MSRAESSVPKPITPERLLRVMAWAGLLAGIGSSITMLLPHEVHTHDMFLYLSCIVLGMSGLVAWLFARYRPTVVSVHLAVMFSSIGLLMFAWGGMSDLGGIDAAFLLIPIAISATVGPTRWVVAVVAFQVTGYAIVLMTSDSIAGFDKPTQWIAVFTGLAIGAAYQTMVRHQLELAHSAMHDTAMTDQLTGLRNRRGAELLAATLLAEATPLHAHLLLVDLDHFKSINDTWGHAVGDDVLALTGRALRTIAAASPDSSFAFRLGGEEFGLLVIGLDVRDASEIAEQLRAEIAAHTVDAGPEHVGVTASVGLATWASEHDTWNMLLQQADIAMYMAKESGRDRVVISESSEAA